ncbi:MAG: hypothetical protein DRP68_06725, partial [Candidatus Omnitrophota bacterium]
IINKFVKGAQVEVVKIAVKEGESSPIGVGEKFRGNLLSDLTEGSKIVLDTPLITTTIRKIEIKDEDTLWVYTRTSIYEVKIFESETESRRNEAIPEEIRWEEITEEVKSGELFLKEGDRLVSRSGTERYVDDILILKGVVKFTTYKGGRCFKEEILIAQVKAAVEEGIVRVYRASDKTKFDGGVKGKLNNPSLIIRKVKKDEFYAERRVKEYDGGKLIDNPYSFYLPLLSEESLSEINGRVESLEGLKKFLFTFLRDNLNLKRKNVKIIIVKGSFMWGRKDTLPGDVDVVVIVDNNLTEGVRSFRKLDLSEYNEGIFKGKRRTVEMDLKIYSLNYLRNKVKENDEEIILRISGFVHTGVVIEGESIEEILKEIEFVPSFDTTISYIGRIKDRVKGEYNSKNFAKAAKRANEAWLGINYLLTRYLKGLTQKQIPWNFEKMAEEFNRYILGEMECETLETLPKKIEKQLNLLERTTKELKAQKGRVGRESIDSTIQAPDTARLDGGNSKLAHREVGVANFDLKSRVDGEVILAEIGLNGSFSDVLSGIVSSYIEKGRAHLLRLELEGLNLKYPSSYSFLPSFDLPVEDILLLQDSKDSGKSIDGGEAIGKKLSNIWVAGKFDGGNTQQGKFGDLWRDGGRSLTDGGSEEASFENIRYALEIVKEDIFKNIRLGSALTGNKDEKVILDWKEGNERVIFEIMPNRQNAELRINRYYGGLKGFLDTITWGFMFGEKYGLKRSDGVSLKQAFQNGETVPLKDIQVVSQKKIGKNVLFVPMSISKFMAEYLYNDKRFMTEFAKGRRDKIDAFDTIQQEISAWLTMPLEARGHVVKTGAGRIGSFNSYRKALYVEEGVSSVENIRNINKLGEPIFNYHFHPQYSGTIEPERVAEASTSDIINIIDRGGIPEIIFADASPQRAHRTKGVDKLIGLAYIPKAGLNLQQCGRELKKVEKMREIEGGFDKERGRIIMPKDKIIEKYFTINRIVLEMKDGVVSLDDIDRYDGGSRLDGGRAVNRLIEINQKIGQKDISLEELGKLLLERRKITSKINPHLRKVERVIIPEEVLIKIINLSKERKHPSLDELITTYSPLIAEYNQIVESHPIPVSTLENKAFIRNDGGRPINIESDNRYYSLLEKIIEQLEAQKGRIKRGSDGGNRGKFIIFGGERTDIPLNRLILRNRVILITIRTASCSLLRRAPPASSVYLPSSLSSQFTD